MGTMRRSDKSIQIRRGRRLMALLLGGFIVVLGVGGSVAGATGAEEREVQKAGIRDAVVQFLLATHPWKTADVRICKVRVPNCINLPPQDYDLSMRVPPNSRYLGHTPVEVTLNKGRVDEKRIWVSAYVEVLTPVVVLKRPLARNQTITADDVALENEDLAKIPAGAVTDVGAVVGQRLKRTLGVGTVLRSAWLDKPTIVRRGDVVKLMIETETLKITTLGRVDERGGMGDTVRVVNLDSKRRVYGQVVDNQTIRVRY
jgi:flagella basal body P-ring formation protein FlgA